MQSYPQQPGSEHGERGTGGEQCRAPPLAPDKRDGDGRHEHDTVCSNEGEAPSARTEQDGGAQLGARFSVGGRDHGRALGPAEKWEEEREEKRLRHDAAAQHERRNRHRSGECCDEREGGGEAGGRAREPITEHGDGGEKNSVRELEDRDVLRKARCHSPQERKERGIAGWKVRREWRAREIEEPIAIPGGERLGEDQILRVVIEDANRQRVDGEHRGDECEYAGEPGGEPLDPRR